ncbi:alpha-L-fucosidase, partial [Maribacter dokdonensis]|uniref:alpha-L-fucosidase n=1 Tax=Maribacter dokdonensis TaxID=320912 RepID=UPI003D6632D8
MNMNKYFVLPLIGLLILTGCKSESEKKNNETVETEIHFEPNWESIKKNYKDPEWFNDQKFGIFIHWGAYAVPAYSSEWYPRRMYMDTATFSAQLNHQQLGPNEVYLYHKKKYGDQK